MRLRNAFGLAAILAVILSTSALAATEKAKMAGGVNVSSPCNGQLVTTTGNLLLEVATNPDGSITVKMQYKGLGADEDGVTFKTELNARETQTGSFPGTFSIAYTGEFAGKPPAQNFSVDGMVDVYVDANGVPTGASITSLNATCLAF